jgi:hypothetical protein
VGANPGAPPAIGAMAPTRDHPCLAKIHGRAFAARDKRRQRSDLHDG